MHEKSFVLVRLRTGMKPKTAGEFEYAAPKWSWAHHGDKGEHIQLSSELSDAVLTLSAKSYLEGYDSRDLDLIRFSANTAIKHPQILVSMSHNQVTFLSVFSFICPACVKQIYFLPRMAPRLLREDLGSQL